MPEVTDLVSRIVELDRKLDKANAARGEFERLLDKAQTRLEMLLGSKTDSIFDAIDGVAIERTVMIHEKQLVEAQNARLREALVSIQNGAVNAYGKARYFIDCNVPGWVRGDDGPVYGMLQVADVAKKALAESPAASLSAIRAEAGRERAIKELRTFADRPWQDLGLRESLYQRADEIERESQPPTFEISNQPLSSKELERGKQIAKEIKFREGA